MFQRLLPPPPHPPTHPPHPPHPHSPTHTPAPLGAAVCLLTSALSCAEPERTRLRASGWCSAVVGPAPTQPQPPGLGSATHRCSRGSAAPLTSWKTKAHMLARPTKPHGRQATARRHQEPRRSRAETAVPKFRERWVRTPRRSGSAGLERGFKRCFRGFSHWPQWLGLGRETLWLEAGDDDNDPADSYILCF